MDNSFAQRYAHLSNKEILNIVSFIDEYSPEAQEAARVEFHKRGLSMEEVETNRAKIVSEKDTRSRRLVEDVKAQQFFSPQLTTYQKIFNGVCIALILYYLYAYFLEHVRFILLLIKNENEYEVDIYYLYPIVATSLSVIFSLGSLILFWRRFWLGWYLFVIYVVNDLIAVISYFIRLVEHISQTQEEDYGFVLLQASEAITGVYFTIVFFVLLLLYVYTRELRSWFTVSLRASMYMLLAMIIIIGIAVFIGIQNANQNVY